MLHKSFDILDAKADSEKGTFEATVAVFGNVDKGGDRILPGAFKDTLAKWTESGDPIPVILSHQWDNPMAHVGVVNEAVETEKGLFVKGTLDVKDNDVARQVHRLMMRRSLKEFSFGYSVPKGGEKRAKDGANELSIIDLAEVGPTLKGMNPATELHAVKAAVQKEGKRLVSDVREQLDALGAKRFAADKDTWVYVDDFDPDQRWVIYHVAGETQNRRFVKVAYATDDAGNVSLQDGEIEVVRTTSYREKADETDKGTKSRSVDPLRRQADEVALRYASGGLSLEKPPEPVVPPRPELVPIEELKQRMRDDMLIHLNGDIE